MPVTINLEPRPGELRPSDWRIIFGNAHPQQDPNRFLAHSMKEQFKTEVAKAIAGKAWNQSENQSAALFGTNGNGLVFTALSAYAHHYHLEIRPDDVWLSILTQFNTYTNANSDEEEVRESLVKHEGRKNLVLNYNTPSDSFSYESCAKDVLELLENELTEAGLIKWVIPAFSTTSLDDQVAAAIVTMGTVTEYFEYKVQTNSGIPSVTLLGMKEDWQKILIRIEMLQNFGEQVAIWYELLRPVLQRFVNSFNDPVSATNFWATMIYQEPLQLGTNYFSGWLSAFCHWDKHGSPPEFRYQYGLSPDHIPLCLDTVKYYTIDTSSVASGCVSVPVNLIHRYAGGRHVQATFAAGSVGMVAKTRRTWRVAQPGEDVQLDTLSPVSAWYVFQTKDPQQLYPEPSIDELQQQLMFSTLPNPNLIGISGLETPFVMQPSSTNPDSGLGATSTYPTYNRTVFNQTPKLPDWSFPDWMKPTATTPSVKSTTRADSPFGPGTPTPTPRHSRSGTTPQSLTPTQEGSFYTDPNSPPPIPPQFHLGAAFRRQTTPPTYQADIPTHNPFPTPRFHTHTRDDSTASIFTQTLERDRRSSRSPALFQPTATLHPITATEMPITHASFQHQMNVYYARALPPSQRDNPFGQVPQFGGPPVPQSEAMNVKPDLGAFGIEKGLAEYYGNYLEMQRQAAWRRG